MTTPDPAVGSTATYHGSLVASHGDGYRVFPCDSPLSKPCDLCRDAVAEGHTGEPRFALVPFDGRKPLTHVRASSFTATPIAPTGSSVPVRVNGFLYLGSHVSPSPYIPGVHRLHFYTCESTVLGSVHVRLDEPSLARFADHGAIAGSGRESACDAVRADAELASAMQAAVGELALADVPEIRPEIRRAGSERG